MMFGVAACGDKNNLTGVANNQNAAVQVSVYALSGTPAALPAAYYFSAGNLARPQLLSNGTVNFELAFDLTTDGKVLVLPARIVVPEAPVPAPSVGILRSTISFASIARAPTKGFVRDSSVIADVGDAFVLELVNAGCTFSQPLYAKFTVDSILVAERRVVFSTLVNRNCGFRSLLTGLPKD